jgi:hypothetical protein
LVQQADFFSLPFLVLPLLPSLEPVRLILGGAG